MKAIICGLSVSRSGKCGILVRTVISDAAMVSDMNGVSENPAFSDDYSGESPDCQITENI